MAAEVAELQLLRPQLSNCQVLEHMYHTGMLPANGRGADGIHGRARAHGSTATNNGGRNLSPFHDTRAGAGYAGAGPRIVH